MGFKAEAPRIVNRGGVILTQVGKRSVTGIERRGMDIRGGEEDAGLPQEVRQQVGQDSPTTFEKVLDWRYRTDNCVKNYFYCNLRKGFKKINKFLTLPANRGKFREIKMTVLQKCIAVI